VMKCSKRKSNMARKNPAPWACGLLPVGPAANPPVPGPCAAAGTGPAGADAEDCGPEPYGSP
jgi:hypothetical protein